MLGKTAIGALQADRSACSIIKGNIGELRVVIVEAHRSIGFADHKLETDRIAGRCFMLHIVPLDHQFAAAGGGADQFQINITGTLREVIPVRGNQRAIAQGGAIDGPVDRLVHRATECNVTVGGYEDVGIGRAVEIEIKADRPRGQAIIAEIERCGEIRNAAEAAATR